jgi:hypothetical protein
MYSFENPTFFLVFRRRVSYLKQKSVLTLSTRHLFSDVKGFIPCHRFLSSNMPPVVPKTDPIKIVEDLIKNNRIAVFSKTTCPYCIKVVTTCFFFLIFTGFSMSFISG